MNKRRSDIDRWKKIVRAFPSLTVTALVDLVADEFVFGEIARVSREAPVLILKHRERTVVPGGGANAVMNLRSLGVKVLPVGVVGDDEPGKIPRNKDLNPRDYQTEGPCYDHQDPYSGGYIA